MKGFLDTVTPDRARELLGRFGAAARRERVPLDALCGRVAAGDVLAPAPEPAFARAQMDGWAVRARDTFGASETAPLYLALDGRVAMGAPPGPPLAAGACREVHTGAALPEGADAVVMVEHAREVGGQVELARAAAAREHVLGAGDDLAPGAVLLEAGARIAPHRLAPLAALGVLEVECHARPRVGILSTGDELVPADTAPGPGQVRDQNAAVLAAQVREAGGEPVPAGRVADDPGALVAALRPLVAACELVLVSGGSSASARDFTAQALDALGPPGVLAHGIRIAPGKPTLLAAAGDKPVLGLPGHPVASFVVFRVFGAPLVRRLGGERGACDPFPRRARARLARKVASKPGREEWVRVRLEGGVAHPLTGPTGALSSLLAADGCAVVPLEAEGLDAGAEVEVLLF